MNYLLKLVDSHKTVFNTKDLAIIWGITDQQQLKNQIYYWTQNHKLIRLHQGIFAFNDQYDRLELAGKLCYPSYISLETVLVRQGVIFQQIQSITSVSNRTRFYLNQGQRFSYHKLKDQILYNRQGIINFEHYAMADLERAFLDMIYLYGDYHFDNPRAINWAKAIALSDIYNNQSLKKRLLTYHKNYVESSST